VAYLALPLHRMVCSAPLATSVVHPPYPHPCRRLFGPIAQRAHTCASAHVTNSEQLLSSCSRMLLHTMIPLVQASWQAGLSRVPKSADHARADHRGGHRGKHSSDFVRHAWNRQLR
jgi:hypothetical protein